MNITFIVRYIIMVHAVKCPAAHKLLSCPLHMYARRYTHSDVLVIERLCA